MELTSENVETVFKYCLFAEGEDTDEHVKAKAINMTVGFHPDRLLEKKQDIIDMLDCLPKEFKKGTGDGMSFLKMCVDKNDVQWTSFHAIQDQLVALGLASETLSYLMPREIWEAFPSGMPYLVIN